MKFVIIFSLMAFCSSMSTEADEISPGILRTPDNRFENLDDYLKNVKDNSIKNILITHLSNFESFEQSGFKIDNPIFYLTSKKNKKLIYG